MDRGKRTRGAKGRRWLSAALAGVLTALLFPAAVFGAETGAARTLLNPYFVEAPNMEAKQTATWDCVWFGAYPQAEVVTAEMNREYTFLEEKQLADGDLVVSDRIYGALAAAGEDEWDGNHEMVLDGVKYRRVGKADATFSGENGSYRWTDSPAYHYFQYEPVKWRVLAVEEDRALLLADKVLDDLEYHPESEAVTWETAAIRSWLNGYGSSENKQGKDYRSRNFVDSAFTPQEQEAIVLASVKAEPGNSYEAVGGNDTEDRLFLLSLSEICTEKAVARGFIESRSVDEARLCKSSVYAKAMGAQDSRSNPGYCGEWWLRNPGDNSNWAACVMGGSVSASGNFVNQRTVGVRPALYVDLSQGCHRYAKAVSSDGTQGINIADCGTTVLGSGYTYTGQPQTPGVAVSYNGASLTENRDYRTVYSAHTGVGTARVAVTGIGNYTGTVIRTFEIGKAKQTVKAVVSPSAAIRPGGTAQITAEGIGQISYSSGNPAVATVSGNGGVTGIAPGTAAITVSAAGDRNYQPAVVTVKITVTAEQSGGNSDSSDQKPGANTGGTPPGGQEKPSGNPGENSNGSGGENPGGNIGQNPGKKQQVITAASKTVVYGSKSFSLKAKASGGGRLTYTSSNTKVAAVSAKGKVTVKGYGQAVITIRAAAKGNYLAVEKKITIKVVPKTPKIKRVSAPGKRTLSAFWVKDKAADGYQIQFCLKKNFRKGVIDRPLKKSKSSIRLQRLKRGKKYYVRLRSYKKVGKVKFYSKWSGVKQVKIK